MSRLALDIRRITPPSAPKSAASIFRSSTTSRFAAVRQALLEHLVILFRDQILSPADHLAFARRFGELEPPHPVFGQLPEHPQISVLENRGNQGVYNDEWHTDVTFPHPSGLRLDPLRAAHSGIRRRHAVVQHVCRL